MNQINELIEYRYAFATFGKRTYVTFYCFNPAIKKLDRVRIYIDKHQEKYKKRIANNLIQKINLKLDSGWNYFISESNSRNFVSVLKCVDIIENHKMSYIRESSKKNYRSRLQIFREWLKKSKIDQLEIINFNKKHCSDFLDYVLQKKISGRTYNNYLVDFRTFFNLLVEKDYIPKNPFREIKRIPEQQTNKRYFTEPELKKYIDWVQQYDYNMYVISGLCYYCGLRPKEICELQVKDIDFKNNIILVSASTSKSKKVRYITIPKVFKNDLERYINDSPQSYYICGAGLLPTNKKTAPTRIAERFAEIRSRLKMDKDLYFYSLKDTCAERLLKSGFSIKDLRDLFGHSSIGITDAYLKNIKSVNKKILEEFPDWR
jgi:integrase